MQLYHSRCRAKMQMHPASLPRIIIGGEEAGNAALPESCFAVIFFAIQLIVNLFPMSKKQSERAKQIYVGIIIGVIVLALFLVLIMMGFSTEEKQLAGQWFNQKIKPAPKPSAPQKQLFSYVGQIQTITGDGFSILAKGIQNQLEEDKVISVRVGEGTEYAQIMPPQNMDSGGSTNGTLLELSYEKLNVGDEVLVFSGQEVTGQTSMEASLVQRVRKGE